MSLRMVKGWYYIIYRHCQSLIVWSTLPVATTGLVWQYAIHVTKWECASNVFEHRPVFKSQILIVLSSEALSKYLPLGWTTNPLIQLSWPTKVCNNCPFVVHNLMVLSLDPVITYWPGNWSFDLFYIKLNRH